MENKLKKIEEGINKVDDLYLTLGLIVVILGYLMGQHFHVGIIFIIHMFYIIMTSLYIIEDLKDKEYKIIREYKIFFSKIYFLLLSFTVIGVYLQA